MQEETTNPIPPVEEESAVVHSELLPEPVIPPKKPPFFIFNFNTVLGLIAIAGVVLLIVLQAGQKPYSETKPVPVFNTSGKNLSVVFVNIDSLNLNYEFVKTLRGNLENTGMRLQKEVLSEQSALEKEAADFQRQIAANAIPEEKAKGIYEQLMQRQQTLMEKKERYTQQVADQELNMNLQLVDSVTAFLKRYNRQYGFDYILGYKTAGEILIANDTLDITASVLEALNKEYLERKK